MAVVLTCHNDAATLLEAVDSIRSDTSDPELVVVDDGSTDASTLRLLEELRGDGIRVVRQTNQGQAAAAMTGVAATSAPYVMRFDSDDVLEPGGVAALADALDASVEAGAAWGDVQTFGITNFRIRSAPELDPWLVTYTNCVTGSGSLLRRTALLECGGWRLAEGFEDWDLWMSLAERGYSAVYVPYVIFKHRRDEGGRLAGWLGQTEAYYEELRDRHDLLFASRRENRRLSHAPFALKIAAPTIDALPFVPRLLKIQLCELSTRLLWTGGIRSTTPMVRQALGLRLRRRRGSRGR